MCVCVCARARAAKTLIQRLFFSDRLSGPSPAPSCLFPAAGRPPLERTVDRQPPLPRPPLPHLTHTRARTYGRILAT